MSQRVLVALAAGILIFAGLPIISWGADDLQGYTAHPARLGYTLIVIVLQFIVVARFPGIGRSGSDGQKLVRRQKIAVILLQVITLSMMILIPFSERRAIGIMEIADALRITGVALFTLGFLLMNWSEAVLGSQFSIQVTIQKDHHLITEGPYHYLRHPRYLAIIIYNLGVALVFRSWLGLILVAALTGVLLWRIQDEEALLQQEFKGEWDAYAKQSWRLIPYVY